MTSRLRKLITTEGPSNVARAIAKFIESGEKKPRAKRGPYKRRIKQPKLR